MQMLFILLLLAINFVISWSNASCVGRYWSESKAVGGSFRREVVCGYVMAVAGFTMVYGYILLMLAPFVMVILGADADMIAEVQGLGGDLIYLLVGTPIVLSGFRIWIQSLRAAWKERSFSYLATAGWNSYAQIHNTISFVRNAPSAFGRVCGALFGGSENRSRSSKKKDTIVIYLVIAIVLIAILGGYFTADAIMKRADAEYDLFAEVHSKQHI